MIDWLAIKNRVERHIGEPLTTLDEDLNIDGRFTKSEMDTMLYASIHEFFAYSQIILTKNVNESETLHGLYKIHSITDYAGNRYKKPLYEIRGDTIFLIDPKIAKVNYLYGGAFKNSVVKELLKFSDGLDYNAEESIFYFFLARIWLLDEKDNRAYIKEAIRQANLCKKDTLANFSTEDLL